MQSQFASDFSNELEWPFLALSGGGKAEKSPRLRMGVRMPKAAVSAKENGAREAQLAFARKEQERAKLAEKRRRENEEKDRMRREELEKKRLERERVQKEKKEAVEKAKEEKLRMKKVEMERKLALRKEILERKKKETVLKAAMFGDVGRSEKRLGTRKRVVVTDEEKNDAKKRKNNGLERVEGKIWEEEDTIVNVAEMAPGFAEMWKRRSKRSEMAGLLSAKPMDTDGVANISVPEVEADRFVTRRKKAVRRSKAVDYQAVVQKENEKAKETDVTRAYTEVLKRKRSSKNEVAGLMSAKPMDTDGVANISVPEVEADRFVTKRRKAVRKSTALDYQANGDAGAPENIKGSQVIDGFVNGTIKRKAIEDRKRISEKDQASLDGVGLATLEIPEIVPFVMKRTEDFEPRRSSVGAQSSVCAEGASTSRGSQVNDGFVNGTIKRKAIEDRKKISEKDQTSLDGVGLATLEIPEIVPFVMKRTEDFEPGRSSVGAQSSVCAEGTGKGSQEMNQSANSKSRENAVDATKSRRASDSVLECVRGVELDQDQPQFDIAVQDSADEIHLNEGNFSNQFQMLLDNLLEPRHFDSIRNDAVDKWLTGEAVFFGLIREASRINQDGGEVSVLHPDVFVNFFNETDIDRDGILNGIYHRADVRTLLIPMMMDEHWSLGVLHVKEGKITVYDSSRPPKEDQKYIEKVLKRLSSTLLPTSDYGPIRCRYAYASHADVQMDSYNCGLHVIVNARRILEGRKNLKSKPGELPNFKLERDLLYKAIMDTIEQRNMAVANNAIVFVPEQQPRFTAAPPPPLNASYRR